MQKTVLQAAVFTSRKSKVRKESGRDWIASWTEWRISGTNCGGVKLMQIRLKVPVEVKQIYGRGEAGNNLFSGAAKCSTSDLLCPLKSLCVAVQRGRKERKESRENENKKSSEMRIKKYEVLGKEGRT